MKESKQIKNLNKEIKLLYKKQKGLWKAKKSITRVKQPVGLLQRRNQSVTFHEGLTGDKFEFTRSDGKEGIINLNQKFLQTFPYGNDMFKGYILNEDSAYPIGHDNILVYADMQKQAIDKIQGEELKLLTAKTKATFEGWQKLILAIGGVILAFAVYKIMVGNGQDPTPIIKETVNNITGGGTIIK